MIPRLRLLAWFNVLAAVVFLGPVTIGVMLDSLGRPTVQAQLKSRPLAESLAEVESMNDLEKLRQRALMLERHSDTNRQFLEAGNHFVDRLIMLLVVSMSIAGLGFLVNAGLMMFSFRKSAVGTESNAL